MREIRVFEDKTGDQLNLSVEKHFDETVLMLAIAEDDGEAMNVVAQCVFDIDDVPLIVSALKTFYRDNEEI